MQINRRDAIAGSITALLAAGGGITYWMTRSGDEEATTAKSTESSTSSETTETTPKDTVKDVTGELPLLKFISFEKNNGNGVLVKKKGSASNFNSGLQKAGFNRDDITRLQSWVDNFNSRQQSDQLLVPFSALEMPSPLPEELDLTDLASLSSNNVITPSSSATVSAFENPLNSPLGFNDNESVIIKPQATTTSARNSLPVSLVLSNVNFDANSMKIVDILDVDKSNNPIIKKALSLNLSYKEVTSPFGGIGNGPEKSINFLVPTSNSPIFIEANGNQYLIGSDAIGLAA